MDAVDSSGRCGGNVEVCYSRRTSTGSAQRDGSGTASQPAIRKGFRSGAGTAVVHASTGLRDAGGSRGNGGDGVDGATGAADQSDGGGLSVSIRGCGRRFAGCFCWMREMDLAAPGRAGDKQIPETSGEGKAGRSGAATNGKREGCAGPRYAWGGEQGAVGSHCVDV